MRILLADDQSEIRLLTAHQLQQDGHSVVAVADGTEALAEFEKQQFDVILLDEQMPGLGGIEALHAIRGRPAGKQQIVIALTGYNSEPDRQRLLREGFDSVIGKPFRLNRLDAALQAVLESHDSSYRLLSRSVAPQPASQDLLKSVGGDKKLLGAMIRTFLRDTPKRLTQLESAIRLNRPDILASVAHALKGSVAIFRATAAQHYAEQLQESGRRRELSGAAHVLNLLKEEIAKVEVNLRGYAGQTGRSTTRVPGNRRRAGANAKRKPH